MKKTTLHLLANWQQKTPWIRGVLFGLTGVNREPDLRIQDTYYLKTHYLSLLKSFQKLWTQRVTIPSSQILKSSSCTMHCALTAVVSLTVKDYRKCRKLVAV